MISAEHLQKEIDAPVNHPAWYYYQLCIPRGGTVLSLGPGLTPMEDFSTVAASHIVGKTGVVYLVDPQAEMLDPIRYQASSHSIIRGKGGALRYLEYAQVLRSFGIPLSPMVWLGNEGGIESYVGISSDSVDGIVDHDCIGYLMGDPEMAKIQFRKSLINKSLEEAYRVLKPDRAFILQVDGYKCGFTFHHSVPSNSPIINIRTELLRAGFRHVFYREVDDWFGIPISDEIFARVTASFTGSGIESAISKHVFLDAEYVEGDQRYIAHAACNATYSDPHIAPDMIIAIK